MSVHRIIPILLHKNGRLVLSRNFEMHHDVGDAHQITERLKSWDVDELVYLDITPHWYPDHDRQELFEQFLATIEQVSNNCFVPLSAGGGLTNIDQIQRLIHAGADRIILSSAAFETPDLVRDAAHTFGAQAVNVCLDTRKTADGYACFSQGGTKSLDKGPVELAQQMETLGAGEITIQAMHCDGQGFGYDIALIEMITKAVSIPVIALGGAGKWSDFARPLESGAGAAAAANLFCYQELSYKASKEAVLESGGTVRPGTLGIDYKNARHMGDTFSADQNALWVQLGQSGFME